MPTLIGPAARALAFYLPQFHPVAENDTWWGPGFTEWTNVARARRLFPGHQQPTLPADLGFYDLRVAATREAQASMAEQYGIEAFVYWHYWFGVGRTILQRPFTEVLSAGKPDLQFCLAFANQSWTGTWHGAPDRILLEQQYLGAEDEQAHFDHILPAFLDHRYLRIDGKPLFYIFRPELMPDAALFVDRWQAMARAAGLAELYLVAEIGDLLGHGGGYAKAEPDGFDAAVYVRLPARATRADVLRMRAGRKLLKWPERYPHGDEPVPLPPELDSDFLLPNVFPNWDNTPRAGRGGLVLTGATPAKFERQVRAAVAQVAHRPPQQRVLFVKSWNEWAEGNHLEPDLRYGREWLEALSRGLAPAAEQMDHR